MLIGFSAKLEKNLLLGNFSNLKLNTRLPRQKTGKLDVNLSYTKLFRTHILYQIGSSGPPPPPPTISSTLGCISIKFCKILEMPFKVSENTRFLNKSFVWLPWQLFDNMVRFDSNYQNDYEKQVIFKRSQKPQIGRCLNNILCDDSSILVLFKTVVLKRVGMPHFWEGQVEK